MVKNPPANAGLSPWPRKIPHAAEGVSRAPQLPSLCSMTGEATAVRSRVQRLESERHSLQLEKSLCSNKDPAQEKNK